MSLSEDSVLNEFCLINVQNFSNKICEFSVTMIFALWALAVCLAHHLVHEHTYCYIKYHVYHLLFLNNLSECFSWPLKGFLISVYFWCNMKFYWHYRVKLVRKAFVVLVVGVTFLLLVMLPVNYLVMFRIMVNQLAHLLTKFALAVMLIQFG